jgi:hypothetical protein
MFVATRFFHCPTPFKDEWLEIIIEQCRYTGVRIRCPAHHFVFSHLAELPGGGYDILGISFREKTL